MNYSSDFTNFQGTSVNLQKWHTVPWFVSLVNVLMEQNPPKCNKLCNFSAQYFRKRQTMFYGSSTCMQGCSSVPTCSAACLSAHQNDMHKPVEAPYDGPYQILQQPDKCITLAIRGHPKVILLGHLKLACIDSELNTYTTSQQLQLILPFKDQNDMSSFMTWTLYY